MSEGEDLGRTRVFRTDELDAARGEGQGSARRRARGGRRRGRAWPAVWRLALWLVALGMGWWAGTRYFG
ncbi:MAG: hypothetical protein K6V73_10075 [Firmicutes bacterium]|nr:hypothetical protein [Bacillota bacterium]